MFQILVLVVVVSTLVDSYVVRYVYQNGNFPLHNHRYLVKRPHQYYNPMGLYYGRGAVNRCNYNFVCFSCYICCYDRRYGTRVCRKCYRRGGSTIGPKIPESSSERSTIRTATEIMAETVTESTTETATESTTETTTESTTESATESTTETTTESTTETETESTTETTTESTTETATESTTETITESTTETTTETTLETTAQTTTKTTSETVTESTSDVAAESITESITKPSEIPEKTTIKITTPGDLEFSGSGYGDDEDDLEILPPAEFTKKNATNLFSFLR